MFYLYTSYIMHESDQKQMYRQPNCQKIIRQNDHKIVCCQKFCSSKKKIRNKQPYFQVAVIYHSSQLTQLRYGGLRACSCHIQHDCTDQRKTVGISLLIFLSKLLGWTSGRFAGSSILERMIRTEIQTLSLASTVMLDVTSSACFCSSICKNFVAKNNVHDQR